MNETISASDLNDLLLRQVIITNRMGVSVNLVTSYPKEDMNYLTKKAMKMLKAIKEDGEK